jgi:endogenous inhibitor of DNA gyrase (YacG/DUF329 family)
MDDATELKTTQNKRYLTCEQEMVIDYYRQRFVSIPLIRKYTGISEQIISAYSFAHPLPYTHCRNCGVEIHYEPGQRILKYCSKRCRDMAKQKLEKLIPRDSIPDPEQLYCAIELWKKKKTARRISKLANLSLEDVNLLFRFNPNPK